NVPNYVSGSTITLGYRWTGATSTSWIVASNWNRTAVPGATDDVIIDTNSTNQPLLNTAATINSLQIAPSGAYNVTLTMQSPLTVSSAVVVGANGTITHSANTNSEL